MNLLKINMTIFEKVKKLHFPLGEYVVIGAGILEALDIRSTNDVDIIVAPKLFQKLRESKIYKEEVRWGKIFLIGDDIEIGTKLDWENYLTTIEEAINTATVINGVPFLNLQETIKFKQAMGREKDLKDIELIEKYLLTNQINKVEVESGQVEERIMPNPNEIKTLTDKSLEELPGLNFQAKKAIVRNIIDKVIGSRERVQVFGYIPVTSHINVFTFNRYCGTSKRREVNPL